MASSHALLGSAVSSIIGGGGAGGGDGGGCAGGSSGDGDGGGCGCGSLGGGGGDGSGGSAGGGEGTFDGSQQSPHAVQSSWSTRKPHVIVHPSFLFWAMSRSSPQLSAPS